MTHASFIHRRLAGRLIRRYVRTGSVVALAALVSASCGDLARTGRSPSVLVVTQLEATSGANPGQFSGSLESDVQTFVTANINGQQVRVATVFEDAAQAGFTLVLKDPGTPGFPAAPVPLQSVTVTRYHVNYVRADGRNTPGVDVPFPFDGALTITVPAGGAATGAFILVRVQAKLEAPLKALVGAGGANVISTIAEVTFYGHDQAGNDVSAIAYISINFADWGDPA